MLVADPDDGSTPVYARAPCEYPGSQRVASGLAASLGPGPRPRAGVARYTMRPPPPIFPSKPRSHTMRNRARTAERRRDRIEEDRSVAVLYKAV